MPSSTRRNELATLVACIAIAASLLVAPAGARAGGGRLDPSFGRGGLTTTAAGTAGEGGVGLSLAPEGAPVVANLGEGRILHLRPDGGLDRGFGENGRLRLGYSTASEGDDARNFTAAAMAVDSSGRLLLFGTQTDSARSVPVTRVPGGTPSSEALVLRLDPSGARDPSFGGGKGFVRSDFKVRTDLSSSIPLAGAMAGSVDSQGRPVLVVGGLAVAAACVGKGGTERIPRAVVRLTGSGDLDPTFGAGGKTTIGGTQSAKLLLAGEDQLAIGTGPVGGSRPECREGTAVLRLGPTGDPLEEFGPTGLRSFSRLRLGALEASGAVVVDRRARDKQVVERLTAAGMPDPGFGTGGIARVPLPTRRGLLVLPSLVEKEGSLLIVGFVPGAPARHRRAAITVGRLLPNGTLDPEFGAGGWITSALPASLRLTSAQAKLDPQGRLVVAGTAVGSAKAGGEFIVARYLIES